ncbi:MAG: CvpA family protein [Clostridia bacterium]|nr:CvpA family protein [Clostridia bacterium]MBQ3554489.1 CvpA family protein [Clostridia bacterium]
MFNLADIILIAVIVLFVWLGIRKGFVKTVFGLCSIVISIALALSLHPMVSDMLEQSPVNGFVHEQVLGMLPEGEVTENLALPGFLQDSVSEAEAQTKDAIASGIASVALKIISMILVFILVQLILWILSLTLNLITKLPVIHGFNKLLGGVVGAVSGILVVYLVLGLLTFTTALNKTTAVSEVVEDSLVASSMYENNLLFTALAKK